MTLGLLLTLVTSPLAGQSVRSRVEARVPTGAVSTVDSLVQVAAREGLPTEPLVQKALEGGAKHVSAARIGAAAGDARSATGRAGAAGAGRRRPAGDGRRGDHDLRGLEARPPGA